MTGTLPTIADFSDGDVVSYAKHRQQGQPADKGVVTGRTATRVEVEFNGTKGLYWPENLKKEQPQPALA